MPQESTGSIFIISTPQLIEKATSVLETLDTEAKSETKKSFYYYKPQNISSDEMLLSIHELEKDLDQTQIADKNIIF